MSALNFLRHRRTSVSIASGISCSHIFYKVLSKRLVLPKLICAVGHLSKTSSWTCFFSISINLMDKSISSSAAEQLASHGFAITFVFESFVACCAALLCSVFGVRTVFSLCVFRVPLCRRFFSIVWICQLCCVGVLRAQPDVALLRLNVFDLHLHCNTCVLYSLEYWNTCINALCRVASLPVRCCVAWPWVCGCGICYGKIF